MNRQRVMGTIVMIGGLLITLASMPRAFLGWPLLRDSLKGQVSDDALLTAAIGWLFGSFAMATLGIVALVSASQLLRGNKTARTQAIAIGAGYLLFGFWALWYSDGSPHFYGFLVMGGAVFLGALFFRPRQQGPALTP